MKWLVLALGFLVFPPLASAQNTCDGTIVLDYVNPPGRPLQVGDVLHVQGSFGSGPIVGGTFIAFSKVQFDLDCDLHFPLMPPCTDAGPVDLVQRRCEHHDQLRGGVDVEQSGRRRPAE